MFDSLNALVMTGMLPGFITLVVLLVILEIPLYIWMWRMHRRVRMHDQWCMNLGLRANVTEVGFSNLKTKNDLMWEEYDARAAAYQKATTLRAQTGRISGGKSPIEELERGGQETKSGGS